MPVILSILALIIFGPASIAYVRFDGQMSAKRRQEAIARFSVPVGEGTSSRSNSQPSRATRSGKKGKSKEIINDGDFDDDNDGDADSVVRGDQAGDENPRIMLISLKAVSDQRRPTKRISRLMIKTGCTWS